MVWLVKYWMTDAGASILGIYDNEEDAINREKHYRETQDMSTYEGIIIEEYELNQDYVGDWEIRGLKGSAKIE